MVHFGVATHEQTWLLVLQGFFVLPVRTDPGKSIGGLVSDSREMYDIEVVFYETEPLSS